MLENLKKKALKIKEDVFTLWFAYRDNRTPWYAKLLTAVVLAYAFSPVDLIPDFIPVLGYLDDIILIPLGVVLALKLIPREVVEDSRKKVRERGIEKKKNWIAGSIIIAIWILVILAIVFKIFR